jgi:hypothetical protein
MPHRLITIRTSKVHGYGIVAEKDIRPGQLIFYVRGKVRHLVIRSEKDSQKGQTWVGLGKELWLEPAGNNPTVYLNHSCSPNAGIRGKVSVVAMRPIKAGEEITIDYSTTEEDKLWSMECRCGSPVCRKVVQSIHSLSPAHIRRYGRAIPAYFRKVYERHHRTKNN